MEEFISMIHHAMNEKNKQTFNCKVDQGDLIPMKLKHDVSFYLPNVHPKFQIDISKHVEKN